MDPTEEHNIKKKNAKRALTKKERHKYKGKGEIIIITYNDLTTNGKPTRGIVNNNKEVFIIGRLYIKDKEVDGAP